MITQGTPGMEKLWENYGKATNHTWERDLAYMEELESYNGTTLTLGLDPTTPSPGQRVITHEAAGMK